MDVASRLAGALNDAPRLFQTTGMFVRRRLAIRQGDYLSLVRRELGTTDSLRIMVTVWNYGRNYGDGIMVTIY